MAEEKIFKYKGKTTEELKAMPLEELSLLLPSRHRRKINRGFSEEEKKLIAKIDAGEKGIKTHCRDMIVLPKMIGLKLAIYNGKEFVEVLIQIEMMGLRLGELAMTRKIATHTTMGSKKTTVRK